MQSSSCIRLSQLRSKIFCLHSSFIQIQSYSSINYRHAVFVWMMQLTKKIIKNYSHVVSWHRRCLETCLSVHSASSLVFFRHTFTPLSLSLFPTSIPYCFHIFGLLWSYYCSPTVFDHVFSPSPSFLHITTTSQLFVSSDEHDLKRVWKLSLIPSSSFVSHHISLWTRFKLLDFSNIQTFRAAYLSLEIFLLLSFISTPYLFYLSEFVPIFFNLSSNPETVYRYQNLMKK